MTQSSPELPRVVLFGNRGSGTFEGAEKIEALAEQRGVKIAVEVCKLTAAIDTVFSGQDDHEVGGSLTPPMAVIAYPEMRADIGASFCDVETPMQTIGSLCSENEVLFIAVSPESSETEESASFGMIVDQAAASQ